VGFEVVIPVFERPAVGWSPYDLTTWFVNCCSYSVIAHFYSVPPLSPTSHYFRLPLDICLSKVWRKNVLENITLCADWHDCIQDGSYVSIFYTWIGFHIINPLKPEAHLNIYEDSVRTAKKTQHFTITKINWLMLLKEIIAVHAENHTKPRNTQCGQNAELLNVKVDGTYSYHWVLKGKQCSFYKANLLVTERCGGVVRISAAYSGGPGFQSRPRDRVSWLRFFVVLLSPSRPLW
jgi:hypothetical protein